MAKRTSATVKLNRSKIGEVYLGLADGMLAMVERIVTEADVPDADPIGKGLVATGDFAAWVDTKKVGGSATKPRGMKLEKQGITAVAGFGFPGRFLELGTINTRAQPFLTPSAANVIPDAHLELSKAMRQALGSRP